MLHLTARLARLSLALAVFGLMAAALVGGSPSTAYATASPGQECIESWAGGESCTYPSWYDQDGGSSFGGEATLYPKKVCFVNEQGVRECFIL